MFQKNKRRGSTVFDIPYYKALKKYLLFLGQFPTQSQLSNKFNVILVAASLLSFYCPAASKKYYKHVLNILKLYFYACINILIYACIKIINKIS